MPAEPPERLFRDETGAALERAARLEDENQQLRAELSRLRSPGNPRPGRDATTVRTRRSQLVTALVGAGCGLVVLGTVATILAARPSHRDVYLPPVPVTTSPGYASPTAAAVPVDTSSVYVAPPLPTDPNDCSTPYWYDESNVKHYKVACIHPERATR